MNAFRMYYALAWTVGPAIASWVMLAFSYKGLFLCASAVFGAFLVAVWWLVPAKPVRAEAKVLTSEPLLKLLARRHVLAHFVGFVLVFAATTISMMNLPLLVLNTLGGSERHVGIIYSVAPVFELPFMLYFGSMATKRDPASVIKIGVVIAIAYYGLLTLVRAPYHVYPLQILSAATTAVTAGVAITYFQSFLPNYPGRATNLYMNAWRAGSTVGYLIFGMLAQHFGYRAVFAACALFALGTWGLLQVSPPPDEGRPASV
jgi:SET family sugar efflux transporter-like MFS transporter